LSVTPRIIPQLKQALARVRVQPLRASLDLLFAVASAGAVEAALRAYLREGAWITAAR
jgi:hypothetical protein